MTRGRAPARGERGSGTVSVLGTAALGAGLLLAVAVLGQASVTGARAAGAADLAALAASDARRGLSNHEPCTLAGRTAARNGAVVVACEMREDGTVRVAVELARAPLPSATADAVAGPPRSQAPGAGSADPPEAPPPEPSVEASAGTR